MRLTSLRLHFPPNIKPLKLQKNNGDWKTLFVWSKPEPLGVGELPAVMNSEDVVEGNEGVMFGNRVKSEDIGE